MKKELQASDYKFKGDKYNVHYSKSPYFKCWNKIISLLPNKKIKILELGCGPGQFAHMLYDNGFRNYNGVDFSKDGIDKAKHNIPEFNFHKLNILKPKYYSNLWDYDVIIVCEVLEHMWNDFGIFQKIEDDKEIIFTVPNFDSKGHMRFFTNEESVRNRYSQFIEISNFNTIGRVFIAKGKKKQIAVTIGNNLIAEPGVVLGNWSIDIRNHERMIAEGKIIIGDYVFIGANTTIAQGTDKGDTIIGNNVTIGPNVMIGHGVVIHGDVIIHGGANIAGYTTIERGVRIGMGANIRNRLTIGHNAMIGIGAVVVNDILPYEVHVGNPAKYLRNIDD